MSGNKINWSNWVVAIATAVIALFTFLLWSSTNKLWIETKESSELTNKMFKLTYRPYISIVKANAEVSSDEKRINFSFVIKNEGNVIGKIVKDEFLLSDLELKRSVNREIVLIPQQKVIHSEYIEFSETGISKFGTSIEDAMKSNGIKLNIGYRMYYVDNLKNSYSYMIEYTLGVSKESKVLFNIVYSREETDN